MKFFTFYFLESINYNNFKFWFWLHQYLNFPWDCHYSVYIYSLGFDHLVLSTNTLSNFWTNETIVVYEKVKDTTISFTSKQIQWLQFIFIDFGIELTSAWHPVFLTWSIQVVLRPLVVSMKILDVTRALPYSRPSVRVPAPPDCQRRLSFSVPWLPLSTLPPGFLAAAYDSMNSFYEQKIVLGVWFSSVSPFALEIFIPRSFLL